MLPGCASRYDFTPIIQADTRTETQHVICTPVTLPDAGKQLPPLTTLPHAMHEISTAQLGFFLLCLDFTVQYKNLISL